MTKHIPVRTSNIRRGAHARAKDRAKKTLIVRDKLKCRLIGWSEVLLHIFPFAQAIPDDGNGFSATIIHARILEFSLGSDASLVASPSFNFLHFLFGLSDKFVCFRKKKNILTHQTEPIWRDLGRIVAQKPSFSDLTFLFYRFSFVLTQSSLGQRTAATVLYFWQEEW